MRSWSQLRCVDAQQCIYRCDYGSDHSPVLCRRSSKLVEIVADADRHVLLRFSDGTESRLQVSMDMREAVQELQALGVSTKPRKSFWRHLASTAVSEGNCLLTKRLPVFFGKCPDWCQSSAEHHFQDKVSCLPSCLQVLSVMQVLHGNNMTCSLTRHQSNLLTRASAFAVRQGLHATQGLRQSLGLSCAGDPFHADNRMGLAGTLHRISAIRDRDGSVIGLTYRIGRHAPGTPTYPHLCYPRLRLACTN